MPKKFPCCIVMHKLDDVNQVPQNIPFWRTTTPLYADQYFLNLTVVEKDCAVEAEDREDCGEPGITQTECEENGCCYDDKVPNTKWCFTPAQKGMTYSTSKHAKMPGYCCKIWLPFWIWFSEGVDHVLAPLEGFSWAWRGDGGINLRG